MGSNSRETVVRGVARPITAEELQVHVTWLRGQLSAVFQASVAAGWNTVDALSPSDPPWTAGHWIGPHAKVRTDFLEHVLILTPGCIFLRA